MTIAADRFAINARLAANAALVTTTQAAMTVTNRWSVAKDASRVGRFHCLLREQTR